MTLSSFRALLFFAIVVAVYAVPRRCLVAGQVSNTNKLMNNDRTGNRLLNS